jgi:hypothetical protein
MLKRTKRYAARLAAATQRMAEEKTRMDVLLARQVRGSWVESV